MPRLLSDLAACTECYMCPFKDMQHLLFLVVKNFGKSGIQNGYNQTIPNCNIPGKFSTYLRLDYVFARIDNRDKHVGTTDSSHFRLVTPYGDIHTSQYCFSQWLDG